MMVFSILTAYWSLIISGCCSDPYTESQKPIYMAWFHKVAPGPSKDEGMLFLHLKVHICFDLRKTLTSLFISSPMQECILMRSEGGSFDSLAMYVVLCAQVP